MNPQDALQLRDIHLPLSPEQWPPAPGWWLLFFAVLMFLGWLSFLLIKYWRRYRIQKEILASMDALLHDYGEEQLPEFLAGVSILLRRVAMMNFPPQQVAALTGKGWLSFLDLHGGGGAYMNGVGSVLAAGPYTSSSALQADVLNVDKVALLLLTKKWIKRNTH
jgi:hypothetical protein